MATIVIERTFPRPVTGAELLMDDSAGGWCFRAHRTHALAHLLRRDGRRLCCLFDAPDAESVRTVMRRLNIPAPDALWSATLCGPAAGVAALIEVAADADEREALVLASRNSPAPVPVDSLPEMEEQAHSLARGQVTLLGSLVGLDRRRAVCLYQAPDAGVVARTNSTLGLAFDGVWAAALYR